MINEGDGMVEGVSFYWFHQFTDLDEVRQKALLRAIEDVV